MTAMLFAAQSSYALVGAGFHWGFDFSRSMDDAIAPLSIAGLPDGSTISVTRTNFERNAINFGGKVFWDLIPIIPIDAIEVSLNFGIWQYQSMLRIDVPSSGEGLPTLAYDIDLGLENSSESYFGLSGMPYANLHLDFTLRRQLLNLLVVKFDAGIGYSLHMATPILDANFINNNDLIDADGLLALATNHTSVGREISTNVVNAMIDETLGSTAHGMHFLLGVRAKLPVMPIGLYIDAKYMLPFSDSISDAKRGVNASGILINAGISLSI